MMLSKKIISIKLDDFTHIKVEKRNSGGVLTGKKIKHQKLESEGNFIAPLNFSKSAFLPVHAQLDCKEFSMQAIRRLKKDYTLTPTDFFRNADKNVWKITDQNMLNSEFDNILMVIKIDKLIIVSYGNDYKNEKISQGKLAHSIALRRISGDEIEVYDTNLYDYANVDPIIYSNNELRKHLIDDITINYKIGSEFRIYVSSINF